MKRVVTGISNLDNLIDGGLVDKSVTVVSGPAGAGKSLLAMQFIYNGIEVFDEPGMFITIEEGSGNVTAKMTEIGADIENYIGDGKLYMVDLGEIGKEGEIKDKAPHSFEGLVEILKPLITLSGSKRLVLDSLPALGAYYKGTGIFRLSLFKLRRFLQAQNVTSILITESLEDGTPTRFGIEQYIADTFILLSYKEVKKKPTRTLEVRKMRLSKHDSTKHNYIIGEKGIEISK
jgi:circadian clock protein KaiC